MTIQVIFLGCLQLCLRSVGRNFPDDEFVFWVFVHVLQEEVLVPGWRHVEAVAVVGEQLLSSRNAHEGHDPHDDAKPGKNNPDSFDQVLFWLLEFGALSKSGSTIH